MNANTILTAIHTMIIAIVGGMIGVVADIRWWFHDHRDEIVEYTLRFMDGMTRIMDTLGRIIVSSISGALRIGFIITIVMVVFGISDLKPVSTAPTLSAIIGGVTQFAESYITATLQMLHTIIVGKDIYGAFTVIGSWAHEEISMLLAWLATFSC